MTGKATFPTTRPTIQAGHLTGVERWRAMVVAHGTGLVKHWQRDVNCGGGKKASVRGGHLGAV